MLCSVCQQIKFTSFFLYTEPYDGYDRWHSIPDSLKPSDVSRRYISCPHYSSIEELIHSARLKCHVCVQIRAGLFRIRGHESMAEHHRGPIEWRYYPHNDKMVDGTVSREVFAVLYRHTGSSRSLLTLCDTRVSNSIEVTFQTKTD
jgi:hypothetical protein